MRVLVTGGTGFVGSNLALALEQQGHEVFVTGKEGTSNLEGFNGKFLHENFYGLEWDTVGKFDVIFHQAANNDTTSMDKEEMFRVNVEASKELFTNAIRLGCKKIVYASSTAVYGDVAAPYKEDGPTNPLNPYAESKLEMDKMAMALAEAHPEVVIVGLRYCNVYGPRENQKGKRASMIYQLARQMMQGKPRIFKDGEQKRDYLYVKAAVRANLLASEAKESCVVNCGHGSATTFNTIIKLLNRTLGTNWEPEYFDNPIEDKYQNHTQCDMSLAKEKIGFVPEYDVEKGIEDYYQSGFLVGK